MKSRTIWVGIGLIAVVLLAYLASQVGGIAARGVRSGEVDVALTIGEPVVPGVATSVRWQAVSEKENSNIAIQMRDGNGERTIGTGQLVDGQTTAIFPCDVAESRVGVTLALADATGPRQVIEWTTVDILPPGPDCLR